MHELSIVEALIDQVQQEVDHSGQPGRIVRLELIIGRFAGVYCDSIRFAFELLSAGTPLEQTELLIREPKATVCCSTCNTCVEVDELVLKCPECGGENVTIEGGWELLIQSIEIEDLDCENHRR
jgi:hydrogenase nickel incorporation protein HypA/HybF